MTNANDESTFPEKSAQNYKDASTDKAKTNLIENPRYEEEDWGYEDCEGTAAKHEHEHPESHPAPQKPSASAGFEPEKPQKPEVTEARSCAPASSEPEKPEVKHLSHKEKQNIIIGLAILLAVGTALVRFLTY